MAKVAKKKHTTNGKPNSRASRRIPSPPLPSTSTTTTTKHLPSSPHALPTTTSTVLSGAITKSSKPKSKPLKRQQRIRRLQAVSKAEAFGDRVVKKVDRSRQRGGTRRERRRGWEDVNAEVGDGEGRKVKRRIITAKGEKEGEGDGDGGLDGEGKGEGWEDVREKGKRTRDGEGGGSSDEEEMRDEVDKEIRMADVSAEVRNVDGHRANGLMPGVTGGDEEEL